jgi:Leucine-rich repeat (LRR) protein
MTPHHLFYVLSRFSELGIEVGPMDIRLENINTNVAPGNYVSFLSEAQRKKIRSSDRDSIHSVSSMRSVMSSMSSLWTSLGLTSEAKAAAKAEKQKAIIKEDLRYLYSAFTKVPCLRLAPDHRAPLIAGYEEFPFDTAVPLFAFKNVSALEINDMDFRQFCGWDRMADQLRSLTIKRGNLDDLTDLIINIVLDDMDKRRRRSAKAPPSPVVPWPAQTTSFRHSETVSTDSTPESPPTLNRPESYGSDFNSLSNNRYQSRPRSTSPVRPSISRHGSAHGHSRTGTPKLRRSSGSSGSSAVTNTPRGSSSNLLVYGILPMSKWRFLRHLSLADNSLTSVAPGSLSPLANTLQSLDLSSNLFTEIPDSLASLVSLRALNLSHCMIESLHSLARNPLPAITTLNLRANRLQSLAGIERLLSLERLDLRENKLSDPTEIARLTGIPNMTEIYVYKNPFTKSHPNYRTTIFNLFRNTPGYIDDIYVDTTQPTYGERKSLIDRVPEAPNVPVVKPRRVEQAVPVTAREPIIEPFNDPFYERRKSQEMLRQRRKSDFNVGSQRRKKGTRRRVVELTETDFSAERRSESIHTESTPTTTKASLTDDSTYGGSEVESTPVRARAPIDSFPPNTTPTLLDTSNVSPALLRTSSESAAQALAHLGVDSEAYKQRIEVLRNDFGNGWLSALSDDNWDTHQRAPGFEAAFGTGSPLSTPLGPVRSASQGIVSGGRTLG